MGVGSGLVAEFSFREDGTCEVVSALRETVRVVVRRELDGCRANLDLNQVTYLRFSGPSAARTRGNSTR